MTKAVELAQIASTGVSEAFKNRIINGAMMMDQRNAGASISFAGGVERKYTVDRWSFVYFQNSKFTGQQNLNSITPPAGFTNYFGLQTTATFTPDVTEVFALAQLIEGYNIADFGWGTANAQTVTLSFWVRSSLTGTFGGSFVNASSTRSYPYSYTINSANTWEYKTITVAGDTSGTWNTTNGVGVYLAFSLATGSVYSGTSGAWTSSEKYSVTGATTFGAAAGQTFYITGVQLEVGSTATSFEYRSYGTELQLCQRYYQTVETVSDLGVPTFLRRDTNSNTYVGSAAFPTRMRASASVNYTFTNLHKPGVRFDTFGSVTVDANATEWFMQLVPTNNDTSSIACFPRTGGFQFAAEL
jgi:hypothetical protein